MLYVFHTVMASNSELMCAIDFRIISETGYVTIIWKHAAIIIIRLSVSAAVVRRQLRSPSSTLLTPIRRRCSHTLLSTILKPAALC